AMDDADRYAGVVVLLHPTRSDDPSVLLEQPAVAREIRAGEPGRAVGHAHPRGAAEEVRLVLSEKCRDSGEVLGRDRADVHAATSESRFSASPVRLRSSMSGCGSASSPRRLIQTVRRPSAEAGAMSWKRLA